MAEELETEELEPGVEPEIEEDDDLGVVDEPEEGVEPEGDEPEEEPVQERKQSRGETRYQKLVNEKRELKERVEKLEQERSQPSEADRLRHQAEQARLAAEERQRIEAMDPDQRVLYQIDQRFQRQERELAQARFESNDRTDKAEFAARASSNKLYANYIDRVEKELKVLRSNGQNMNREAILKYLVGQDVIAKAGSTASKATASGARKVNAARTRSVSGRGDVGQDSSKSKGFDPAEFERRFGDRRI